MSEVDISKLHVLVVDDEIFMRNLIKRLLEEINTGQVSSAGDGYKALSILKEAQPKVDVILLDIEMPRMDGFQFLERMQSDLIPSLSNTPVIIISVLINKAAMDKAQNLGVSVSLSKPITRQQLTTPIIAAVWHSFQ